MDQKINTYFDIIHQFLFKEDNVSIVTPLDLVVRELSFPLADGRCKNVIDKLVEAWESYYYQICENLCNEVRDSGKIEGNSLLSFQKGLWDFYEAKMADFIEIINKKEDVIVNIQNLDKEFENMMKKKLLAYSFSYYEESADMEENNEIEILNQILEKLDPLYLSSLIANQFFEIFVPLCHSVLRAEYLYDDKLSKDKIVPLLQAFRLKQQNKLGIGDEDVDYYLGDVAYLCEQYYNFNRRIDNAIDPNIDAVLQVVTTHNTGDELTLFKIAMKTFYTQGFHPVFLLKISQVFVYLFRYILEMSYIDHNFAVGEDELKSLLQLRILLKNIYGIIPNEEMLRKSYKEENVSNELVKNLVYIDNSITKKLLKILRLVEFKNDYLIYKIYKSDKSNRLKNYTYLTEGNIITFNNDKDLIKKLGILQKINAEDIWEEYCPEQNILREQGNAYNAVILKERKQYTTHYFTEYEQAFLNVVLSKENEKELTKKFSQIKQSFDKCNVTIKGSHEDIISYNEKIILHAESQFINYGRYIKKLSRGIRNEGIEKYAKEIIEFLDMDKETPVFSCTFILNHLDWALKELDKCKNSKMSRQGLVLRALIEILLNHFERLLRSIEDNTYCINFASLYQDSFYSFTWKKDGSILEPFEKIERLSAEQTTLNICQECEASNEEYVFIASTWLWPVGKMALREKYEDIIERKNKAIADFDIFYFQDLGEELIAKNEMQVKEEVEESRRSTVQVLGIFAAFLALATVSVGAFRLETPLAYFKVMAGITVCLSVFVLLIQFVISPKDKEIRILIVLILTLLLMFLGKTILGDM